ncbi:MAG: hypothetical protein CVT89_02660, partial [Candidatus Altiarchaeales archaeon HGW-Altiarchaeales-2]
GDKARKMHSSRRDAFVSTEKNINTKGVDAFQSFGEPIARVNYLTGNVEMTDKGKEWREVEKKEKVKVLRAAETMGEVKTKKDVFKLNLIDEKIKVGLIKVYPGFDPKILDQFKDYKGLVIEGTGLGHIPQNCLPEIEKLIKNKVKVVMASQTIFGAVNMNVYSRGRELLELGVEGNYNDLPPESVFMWLVVELSKK